MIAAEFGAVDGALLLPDSAPWHLAGAPISLTTPFEDLPSFPGGHLALAHDAATLPMLELRRGFHRAHRITEGRGTFSFLATHPDHGASELWPGEVAGDHRFRPLRHFLELARLFSGRLQVPQERTLDGRPYLRFRFQCSPQQAWGRTHSDYGPDSPYRRFNRLEEPEILDDMLYALSRLHPQPGQRVLSVGVNDGREWELFREFKGETLEFWGIEPESETLSQATARFPGWNLHLLPHRLAEVDPESLPKFDLVLLLGVLQSPALPRNETLRWLDQALAPTGQLLISIPDCHFGDRDILRRPLDRKDPRHDRSLVHKDLRHLARHFYRQGFRRIETFGTYDAFLLVRR